MAPSPTEKRGARTPCGFQGPHFKEWCKDFSPTGIAAYSNECLAVPAHKWNAQLLKLVLHQICFFRSLAQGDNPEEYTFLVRVVYFSLTTW